MITKQETDLWAQQNIIRSHFVATESEPQLDISVHQMKIPVPEMGSIELSYWLKVPNGNH